MRTPSVHGNWHAAIKLTLKIGTRTCAKDIVSKSKKQLAGKEVSEFMLSDSEMFGNPAIII